MSFLLDTHVFLWAIADPAKLSAQVADVIGARSNTLVVSAVTPWELSIKLRRGKLPQAELVLSDYERILDRFGVESLNIEPRHAIVAGRLSWDHRDPFDRMLVAQAVLEDLTFITNDSQIAGAPGVRRLW